MLRPLDIVLCLYLTSIKGGFRGYEQMSADLGIGLSSAHRSVKRLQMASLVDPTLLPACPAILELLIHGVRYVYYVKPGEITRGIPTAHAAPPLSELIGARNESPVWPDPEGKVRGYAIKPLHSSAPAAALRNSRLYELLALTDALRIGRVRERALAEKELRKRILS